MVGAMDISIRKVENSKLQQINFEDLPFGQYFTDHMLEADFENGEWKNVEIKPYQPLLVSPSLAALHYGQTIFEGIKAYRDRSGNAFIFRPMDNYERFNFSARRMEMPEVPEEIFIEGMRQLVALDKNWIPSRENFSLYIRPLMFASDEVIGVRPSHTFKFVIMLSPTGPYYGQPMRIYVEEKFVRAVSGGVGNAKTGGNYAAAMHASAEANKKGYDQVLWTDAFEHKYVQEIGTMNVFAVIGDKAITPDLKEGSILGGVTRLSAITIMKEMGLKVEERQLSIHEIIEAYQAGGPVEVFGTGTAATIAMIKELKYKDFVMNFDVNAWKVAPALKKWITDIREGRKEDKHGWMMKVES